MKEGILIADDAWGIADRYYRSASLSLLVYYCVIIGE